MKDIKSAVDRLIKSDTPLAYANVILSNGDNVIILAPKDTLQHTLKNPVIVKQVRFTVNSCSIQTYINTQEDPEITTSDYEVPIHEHEPSTK